MVNLNLDNVFKYTGFFLEITPKGESVELLLTITNQIRETGVNIVPIWLAVLSPFHFKRI